MKHNLKLAKISSIMFVIWISVSCIVFLAGIFSLFAYIFVAALTDFSKNSSFSPYYFILIGVACLLLSVLLYNLWVKPWSKFKIIFNLNSINQIQKDDLKYFAIRLKITSIVYHVYFKEFIKSI
ncbi:hypothetical protein [Mycoplasma phocoenae]|uniref:Uncharacterized protein n=1 Tax=Mycoplasma phocoenae TaxID=754517 RepID=A0A858U389_9MOLU|nr:hypothetical protein [Mycoplasma phocoenae]QJG66940.1 hypothetical protein HGG69_01215 [Mycoplasma phocoenae]